MNSASDIIDALHHAGATLVIEDGKARVRGSRVPDELVADLRANKAAVLAEWARRQEASLDRFGEVPAADAPMLSRDITVKPAMRQPLVEHLFRQPRPVHAWIMARTLEYHQDGIPLGDDEICACADALAWQRNTTVRVALEWLSGIEEICKPAPEQTKDEKL